MSAPQQASEAVTGGLALAGAPGQLPSVGLLVADRYRLTRVIGAGGMGTVFEAESTSLGRRCAIKFLRPELAGGARTAPRLEREARLLARLEHEHITAVFDFGWLDERTPYFVMEYLQGHTLRERLRSGQPLPIELCLQLLQQACRAMAHAHAAGVVHRDLKPDNLMLTEHSDGRPWLKILDFGIARSLFERDAPLTPSGAELGTAHYMAPEQARGARDIDARADVYSLGAIAYEMLTGLRVHDGASYNEVLFQVLTQRHVPLEQALPSCPSALVSVVERCLEREAAERFADAAELLQALSAVSPLVAEIDSAARQGRPGPPRSSRWRTLVGSRAARALGACALGLSAFLLGAHWRSSARTTATPEPTPAPAAALPPAPAADVLPTVGPRAPEPASEAEHAELAEAPKRPSAPASSAAAAKPRAVAPPAPVAGRPRAEPAGPAPTLPFVTANPYQER